MIKKAVEQKSVVKKPAAKKIVTKKDDLKAPEVKVSKPRSLKLKTKVLTAEGWRRSVGKKAVSPRVKVER